VRARPIVIGRAKRDRPRALRRREGRPRARDDIEIDIAVTIRSRARTLTAGSPGSIAVLGSSTSNGLLHAPDCYMDSSSWVRRRAITSTSTRR
jgi:fructose-1,6-bisphosphatase/sedoheptulose 1,7-bisphosphatase-like protein